MVGEVFELWQLLFFATAALVGLGIHLHRGRRRAIAAGVLDSCVAVERPRVQVFLDEARALRVQIDRVLASDGFLGGIANAMRVLDEESSKVLRNDNTTGLLHGEKAEPEPSRLDVRLAIVRWARSFADGLDDEDRAALHDRGVTAELVAGIRAQAERSDARGLHVVLAALAEVERCMTGPPHVRGYR
jgi:hypothetical protein